MNTTAVTQPSRFSKLVPRENAAAIITWLAFAYVELTAASHNYGLYSSATAALAVSLLLFLGLFLAAQHQPESRAQQLRLFAMWALLAFNAWLVPGGFSPGLGVLWVALLPPYVPQRYLYWMVVPSLLPYALFSLWPDFNFGSLMMLTVCGTFQYFAIFAMEKVRAESAAREALAITHQQLLQTQERLTVQIADAERLRIARDLHDSLGHHLTALVIQLQVAQYQADAAHKPQLSHCHQLAKQLLQDIRHSVSQLRQPLQPHFAAQCKALAENFPQLQLSCQLPAALQLDPFSTTLLFRATQEAVTNSVKHSGASSAQVEVWHAGDKLAYRYQDNGQCTTWPLHEGNGLTGMRERIEQAEGKLYFSKPNANLQIDIELPLPEQGA